MRYQINHNWYFTQHYTGSLNSMPSERLEELEWVQLPHTVKMLPLRYCNEKFQVRVRTFTGWTAQIIQHEVDHCNGIVI